MKLFGFFSKDKIDNENKSKPFCQNANDIERKDWFSRTRPWHKVDSGIIDALISKYGNNPMFEVFVITSMENNLVKDYEALGQSNIASDTACSVISSILYEHGAESSSLTSDMILSGKIDENKLSIYYRNALNLLESSVIIDSNQIQAYMHLAALRKLFNKNEDALKYVHQGLEVIKQIKEKDIPFHKSSIPSIQNAAQHINDIEKLLLTMENDLSR